jgi:DNA replication protein DnaC
LAWKAWPRASGTWLPTQKVTLSITPTGWASWSNRRRRYASRSVSRREHATAKLRHAASVEDVDFKAARGLDRTQFLRLTSCDWIREHRHCLITGPCGVGKSWLACALGDKACRDNLSVLYQRCSRLFAAIALARGDGRYARLMRQLARVDLLILDDWGPEPLLAEQRRDLLEIVEDRYSSGSMIITSQVPVDRWYEIVGDPTLADAILDRIIHNAHRIALKGESLRKLRASA